MQKEDINNIGKSVNGFYLGKSIDQMIWEFMDEKQIPGLTVSIVQPPYISRIIGYGFSNIEQKCLASPQTIWPIGPISQGFTAIAIMQLYERGQIDFNNPIGMYLDTIPSEWKNITILQLLRHCTGIADYRLQPGFNSAHSYTPIELISMVKDIPLAFEPDTNVSQSATNFLLLTELLEKISDKSYHEFITENQISFLKLRHTSFSEDLSKFFQEDVSKTANIHQLFKTDKIFINPAEIAVGYNNELSRIPSIQSSALKGFADIWSSAEDISCWGIGLTGSILVKQPENRALLFSPFSLKNGRVFPAVAGWQFYNHNGLMDIKGSVPGFSSYLSQGSDPMGLVCVTILSNKEEIDFTKLARNITTAFTSGLSTDNNSRMHVYECPFDVQQTVNNVQALLHSKNVSVFSVFDHTKHAKDIGLDLLPTQVIMFGSPAVGTKLMQENQGIALELPLKIAVWEDEKGSVWLATPCMRHIANKYNLEENPIIATMHNLLEQVALKISNAYG